MRSKLTVSLTALALAGAVVLASAPASAQWRGHRGSGWGGPAAGFVAGAIIGGALARPYGYPAYGYYNEPAYGYYEQPAYTYAPAPVYGYAAAPAGADDVTYCQQTYRSYDVRSGTYLGYDGLRHPCP
jgi:hypothetical protein